ncbi:hypothetical protein [Kangiella sp.]|uniref:hypothetical protein n=1 Tax=Kangiella sp. TaxID=1920245 RepID=UPI0019CAFAFD|nr:hypothetical protein [Kangiella sp.]MBD3652594.1 hypothetical protein [Kangiella sp.]
MSERIDLYGLFLQQFVWILYKASRVRCSHSPSTRDNTVEKPNKRCPSGSIKSALLFVARHYLRVTKLHNERRDQNAFALNKNRTVKVNTLF